MARNRRWWWVSVVVFGICGLLRAQPGSEPAVPVTQPVTVVQPVAEPLGKPDPISIEELRGIQSQVRARLDAAKAATVHVEVGPAHGSGVVVTADGYVLTAAHVTGRAERDVAITFADGRRVKGKTLGQLRYPGADAGLIKITDPGPWPSAEMGNSTELRPGDWCFALGYPGGFDQERGPVLRIGRLIHGRGDTLWTDCVLLGGDSGGPLFDLHGRVVGIHSRIARPTQYNFHAPVDRFRDNWEMMAFGVAFMGVSTAKHPMGAVVEQVVGGSAAEKAALQPGDVITHFDGAAVRDPEGLTALVRKKRPQQTAKLTAVREGKTIELDITLGIFWGM